LTTLSKILREVTAFNEAWLQGCLSLQTEVHEWPMEPKNQPLARNGIVVVAAVVVVEVAVVEVVVVMVVVVVVDVVDIVVVATELVVVVVVVVATVVLVEATQDW
jgi:hypothetical protein